MTTAVLRSAQAGAILTSALSRLTRILLLVAVALCLGAPTAGAVPAKKLDNNLEALWKAVLQTPHTLSAPNPLFTDGCFRLGGTLAPFGGPPTGAGPCTVKPGTKIFVAASSAECSNVEEPPFFGTNEDELRKCASDFNVKKAPTVTVDGKSVPVTGVYTPAAHRPARGQHFGRASRASSVRGARLGHAPTPADARAAYDQIPHLHDHDPRSARPLACGAALAIPK